jgi:enoyl-CoA hydratase/carnithine racemase
MQPRHFRYEERDKVALVRLDRPERLNALTFESYTELRDTFRALRERPSVRAVVLTGTGRAFCSGGDVQDIIGKLLAYDPPRLLAFTRLTCELIGSMRLLEKPIIAALNGTTCGAGAVMAIASDLRIAARSAKIAFLFVRVGLSGADMGAGWLLPRIVGLGHASELLLGGEFIGAERAHAIGLYNEVVDEGELLERALERARALARGPAQGLAITKRMLRLEDAMGLEEALSAEGWVQAECMEGRDFHEGFAAAMERREPRFAGAPPAATAAPKSPARAPAPKRAGGKLEPSKRGEARSKSKAEPATKSRAGAKRSGTKRAPARSRARAR